MKAEAETFDYIIVGAGSAGCVLANSTVRGPCQQGGDPGGRCSDNWIWFHIPVGYLFAIGNPRADWLFKTDPEPGLGGRVLNYPRGKVIGGCSAINAMIYMRGQKQDYDGWRQLGLNGWGWDDVKPLFMRQQDHFGGLPNTTAAAAGASRSRACAGDPRRLHRGGEDARHPRDEGLQHGLERGRRLFQVNQRNGLRWSAAKGFLKPALNRPNLKLIKNANVSRILFEGPRAVGVEYVGPKGKTTVKARRR